MLRMSRKPKEAHENWYLVDANIFKTSLQYWRGHVNRLGDYLPDLQCPVPLLDPTIDFAVKSAA
ncbi:hypothetical protein [Paraburkholderia youngii]